MIVIKRGIAHNLPVRLIDDTDFKTRETSVNHASVTCRYIKNDDIAWITKTINANNWIELGNGIYLITFTADELDTSGSFIYLVSVPNILQHDGWVEIRSYTNDDMRGNIFF